MSLKWQAILSLIILKFKNENADCQTVRSGVELLQGCPLYLNSKPLRRASASPV